MNHVDLSGNVEQGFWLLEELAGNREVGPAGAAQTIDMLQRTCGRDALKKLDGVMTDGAKNMRNAVGEISEVAETAKGIDVAHSGQFGTGVYGAVCASHCECLAEHEFWEKLVCADVASKPLLSRLKSVNAILGEARS
jgi:hypothetical protein